MDVAAVLRSTTIPTPISHWERLHRNPSDIHPRTEILGAIEATLKDRLMGPKKIEKDFLIGRVVLRRTRLHYESHVEVFVGGDRHGFDVSVPTHDFKIRITSPRIVPSDVVAAPWDDLLENVCKIDRSIIADRRSKSQPLTYVPQHGPHPSLRVEILSKRRPEPQPPALPA